MKSLFRMSWSMRTISRPPCVGFGGAGRHRVRRLNAVASRLHSAETFDATPGCSLMASCRYARVDMVVIQRASMPPVLRAHPERRTGPAHRPRWRHIVPRVRLMRVKRRSCPSGHRRNGPCDTDSQACSATRVTTRRSCDPGCSLSDSPH